MRAFCEECRDYVEYRVKEEQREKSIKGQFVKYTAKIASCNECQSDIFVSELRDQNLIALDLAYRKSEELITVEEIKTVIQKYNIGKRPLSLILGWGETTLTRYIDGDIPTKNYSETLKRIDSDPEYLLELLIMSRSKISEMAYKKCYTAINEIISSCDVTEKIESVANYLISKSVEITPLALQKLLYFSQAFHKVFLGQFLFTNDCEAWVHGPVYREIYYKYKDHGYNPIEENLAKFDCFELTDCEIEVLDTVLKNFGCYSGKILEKMTHLESPWKDSRKGLSDNESTDKIIEKDLINNYFSLVKEKYQMINIADVKDYSKDLFEKVSY